MHLLWWAIIALVISLISGALGFTGVSSASALVAKVLFWIFLAAFVLLLIVALLGIGLVAH